MAWEDCNVKIQELKRLERLGLENEERGCNRCKGCERTESEDRI